MNELTFVARLGAETRVRYEERKSRGQDVLIARGDVEEKQIDSMGRVLRCDLRLSSEAGRKLASGEMKRPELRAGKDPRNQELRGDARRKALARGLPFYFTCNMAEVVLYAVAETPSQSDREETSFQLAPIKSSTAVEAWWEDIKINWVRFLEDLEQRLQAVEGLKPRVSDNDVLILRDAIFGIADEALGRAARRLSDDTEYAKSVIAEALDTFGLPFALEPAKKDRFQQEVLQLLRFGAFVCTQKLILYRVLQDTGVRRSNPFKLDPLSFPHNSTDPRSIRDIVNRACEHAVNRSGDYETAFTPEPLAELLFTEPTAQEVKTCRVGEVWAELQATIQSVSWASISRNIIGFLYEMIVEPQYRYELGQFYTGEDIVDTLVGYAVQDAAASVLDPAAGGGSFLRAVYERKINLGDTHTLALAGIWGVEITAFAAELATISLAIAGIQEPAAYPRVLLQDFFDTFPGMTTHLKLPDEPEPLCVPIEFDAVVTNPPYISYRHITNQAKILRALKKDRSQLDFPVFSGKSDEYVWFLVHATRFIRHGGRLGWVVSSAILFSDYGLALIRFIGQHYIVHAVIDSVVERWFPYADTNTVLLWLERCEGKEARKDNQIRFVRLRKPLRQLLAPMGDINRWQSVEDLVDLIQNAKRGDSDPRLIVNIATQGENGGLEFLDVENEGTLELIGSDDE